MRPVPPRATFVRPPWSAVRSPGGVKKRPGTHCPGPGCPGESSSRQPHHPHPSSPFLTWSRARLRRFMPVVNKVFCVDLAGPGFLGVSGSELQSVFPSPARPPGWQGRASCCLAGRALCPVSQAFSWCGCPPPGQWAGGPRKGFSSLQWQAMLLLQPCSEVC